MRISPSWWQGQGLNVRGRLLITSFGSLGPIMHLSLSLPLNFPTVWASKIHHFKQVWWISVTYNHQILTNPRVRFWFQNMALNKSRWGRGIGYLAMPGKNISNLRCVRAKQLVRPSTIFSWSQTMSLPMLEFYAKILIYGGYFLGPSI